MPSVTAAPGLPMAWAVLYPGLLTLLCSPAQLCSPGLHVRDALTPHSCNCLCFSPGPLDKDPIKAH